MPSGSAFQEASLKRITASQLRQRLASGPPPLILDVRRRVLFEQKPNGLPGAVPVFLDDESPKIPDLPRDTPMVVYNSPRRASEIASSRQSRRTYQQPAIQTSSGESALM